MDKKKRLRTLNYIQDLVYQWFGNSALRTTKYIGEILSSRC
jgi:hypothetical protein